MIYATASLWRVDFQIHFLKKGGNLWKAPTELEQAVQETRHAVQSLPFGNFQCPSPLSPPNLDLRQRTLSPDRNQGCGSVRVDCKWRANYGVFNLLVHWSLMKARLASSFRRYCAAQRLWILHQDCSCSCYRLLWSQMMKCGCYIVFWFVVASKIPALGPMSLTPKWGTCSTNPSIIMARLVSLWRAFGCAPRCTFHLHWPPRLVCKAKLNNTNTAVPTCRSVSLP